ncbi:hypothetical protein [Streptomyces sp. NPDC001970]
MTQTTDSRPGTWVGGTPEDAVMLQMTRTEHRVTGSLDATSIPDEEPTEAKAGHFGITGTTGQRSITLTLDHMLTVSGSISGTSMTLNFPDRDTGAIEQITLKPGTVEEYNELADGVRQTANKALAAELKDEKERDKTRADAKARTDLDTAAAKVASAYRELTAALGEKAGLHRPRREHRRRQEGVGAGTRAHRHRQEHARPAGGPGSDAGAQQSSAAAAWRWVPVPNLSPTLTQSTNFSMWSGPSGCPHSPGVVPPEKRAHLRAPRPSAG